MARPVKPKILDAFHRTCAPLFEQAEANGTMKQATIWRLSSEDTEALLAGFRLWLLSSK